MRDYRDAKLMAKALRDALRPKADLGHHECLEIVARVFGLKDWNTLSAAIGEALTSRPVVMLPEGWGIGGATPELYQVGLDDGLRHRSGAPAMIRSLTDDVRVGGFATLMQSISAEEYRSTRIRLKAELRTKEVDGKAAIWLRINGSGKTLAFDNLSNRPNGGPLLGSTDWTERRIILEVPEAAESIHFGFTLSGSGQAWASGFALEDAGQEPTTDMVSGLRARPTNLDFAKLRDPN